MTASSKFSSHEAYFATAEPEAKAVLLRIQALIESDVPGATRCISYNMPAFRLARTFVYFAAFKKHIGIYPPVKDDASLIEALAPYRNEKGNLAFPLAKPLPYELIKRVVTALVKQYAVA